MRRAAILVAVLSAVILGLGACRMPYMADYADMTVMAEDFPPAGTSRAALQDWFDENGYAPGPRVLQAEGELRRRRGEPLVYALQSDRRWWLTETRSVTDLCVTTRVVYYRVDPRGNLLQAVRTHSSQC